MRTKSFPAAVLLAALLLHGGQFGAAALPDYFDLSNSTESGEGYYTVRDRADSSVILRTARILHPGDDYIDQDNRHFRVVMIDERTAWAEQIDRASALSPDSPGSLLAAGDIDAPQEKQGKPRVGVYHTHGAESYVPSDGTDAIDQGGGILRVGDSLTGALRDKGFTVNHVREPHTPHDAGAYQRSRRTAEDLIMEGDRLIFDVHRDAVPPEEYEREVEGKEITRILLVVGQQNQNADNNREFAATLKRIADEEHPGLIKGILGAQGNYNQDLTPQAILIEVGAHENNREDAQRAVTLFADVVDGYVSGPGASPQHAARSDRLSLGSVLKVIALVAGALFVYLLIAAGSWEEFKRKIASFFEREFADLRSRGGRGDGERDRD